MITILLMLWDIVFLCLLVLAIARCIRAIRIRAKLMRQIKNVCKQSNCTLKIRRNCFFSLFHKGKQFDFSVETHKRTYLVKLITCFSKIKIYHFVDEENYVTYFKSFIALPMAEKFSESVHWSSYHRFPRLQKTQEDHITHVLLFNPVPNTITYADEKGLTQVAGNGTMIGDLQIFNGKGFCAMLNDLSANDRNCT